MLRDNVKRKKRIFGRSADEVQKDLNQAKEYKVDKNQEEQGKTLLKETVPSIDHSFLSNRSGNFQAALSSFWVYFIHDIKNRFRKK